MRRNQEVTKAVDSIAGKPVEMIIQGTAVLMRAMGDVANRKRIPDVIYLMTHTQAFARYNIARGTEIVLDANRFGKRPKILLAEKGGAEGYEGALVWGRMLIDAGVYVEDIVPIPGALYKDGTGVERINSFTEAEPVVRWCVKNGVEDLTIVAPGFHIARCFAGFVAVANAIAPHLNVFADVSSGFLWDEDTSHSQGTLLGTPTDFCVTEIARWLSYDQPAKPGDVLAYLDRRDRRVKG